MKRPDQCEIDPAEPVMVLHRRGNTDPPHPVGTGEHAERDRKDQMFIVIGQYRFPLRFFDDRFPKNTGFSRLQTERRNERITDFHQPVQPSAEYRRKRIPTVSRDAIPHRSLRRDCKSPNNRPGSVRRNPHRNTC